MTRQKGEGNIPPSPGRLFLTDEESAVRSSIHDPGDMDPSGTVRPVSRVYVCDDCERSPTLLTSQTSAQGVVGFHQVECATLTLIGRSVAGVVPAMFHLYFQPLPQYILE